MISLLFHAVIYNPIYNALIFFIDLFPSHDAGIAVIIVTIIVRVILFPLSKRAIQAQMAMKKVAPEIEAIKARLKEKPAEQSAAIFALYKERNIRPFAGLLLMLIQLPILLGLYWAFTRAGLPVINGAILYSFVHVPDVVNMHFLGLIDMSKRNIVLAFLAMIMQFIYTRLSMGPRGEKTAAEASFSNDMAKSFDLQARYVLPLIVGVIGVTIAAAATLYWVTSSAFMICQELVTGRRFHGSK
ncbi:MAG: 60 kDa inner rane insertion protein preprotein translocase subunit YidC [Candidatus Kaiserbacteria bacterium]|nr:60 kDa inner rane insertion protein preprotein translocase subunit YidC [Candidatus Kaiserbacteria bacterium]